MYIPYTMYLDEGSGLQCINNTLLWNDTDASTDFNHSSGFNFTDCNLWDNCNNDPGAGCSMCMSYGMSLYCIM